MPEKNSEQEQHQKILNQYEKDGYLNKNTTTVMLRLKEKIELRGRSTILSSRLIIADLKKSALDEDENSAIGNFETLIIGYFDKEVLNDEQLKAFEKVREVQIKKIKNTKD